MAVRVLEVKSCFNCTEAAAEQTHVGVSGAEVEKPGPPIASALQALQENLESSITDPVIPLGYFPTSKKVT